MHDAVLIAVLRLHGTVPIFWDAGRQRRIHPRVRDEHPAVGGARSAGQSELVAERRSLPELYAEQFPVETLARFWPPE